MTWWDDLVAVAVHAHPDVPRLGHLVDHAAVGAGEAPAPSPGWRSTRRASSPGRRGRRRGWPGPGCPAGAVKAIVPAVGLGVVVAPDPRVVLAGGSAPVARRRPGPGRSRPRGRRGSRSSGPGSGSTPTPPGSAVVAGLLVQRLAHVRDAEVVEVALQRPGQALVGVGARCSRGRARSSMPLRPTPDGGRHHGRVLQRRVVRRLRVEVGTPLT